MYDRRCLQRQVNGDHIEYKPFSALFYGGVPTAARLKNISGSGVLFAAREHLPVGSQLVMSICLAGRMDSSESGPPGAEPQRFEAIAEVVRVEHDPQSGIFRTGARFVGRVHASSMSAAPASCPAGTVNAFL